MTSLTKTLITSIIPIISTISLWSPPMLANKFIQLSQGLTHYQDSEADHLSASPQSVTLMIHGVSGPMAVWDDTYDVLVKAGHRVVRFDLYGRGQSDRLPESPYDLMTYLTQVEDLVASLQSKSVTQLTFNVIGSSYGAVIASEWSLHHPELVQHLILIGPAGFPINTPLLANLRHVPYLGSLLQKHFGLALIKKQNRKYAVDPDHLNKLWPVFDAQLEVPGTMSAMLATMDHGPVTSYIESYKKIADLKFPVTVYWGRQDVTFPFANAETLARAIPRAVIIPIDHAGHLPQLEQSTITNLLIRDALSNSHRATSSIASPRISRFQNVNNHIDQDQVDNGDLFRSEFFNKFSTTKMSVEFTAAQNTTGQLEFKDDQIELISMLDGHLLSSTSHTYGQFASNLSLRAMTPFELNVSLNDAQMAVGLGQGPNSDLLRKLKLNPVPFKTLSGHQIQSAFEVPVKDQSIPSSGEAHITSGVYFCTTYSECKQRFQTTAHQIGSLNSLADVSAVTLVEPINSINSINNNTEVNRENILPQRTEKYDIDYAFFQANPMSRSKKIVIISSGIHGLEGFTGSAVQEQFMKEILPEARRLNLDVLLIHGINAFGINHLRRTTASRVDLNRNWYVADQFPKALDDKIYDRFNQLLNPTFKANFGSFDFASFVMTSIVGNISAVTDGTLTKASGQGQFRYPQGISFGGTQYEPHRAPVVALLKKYVPDYHKVLVMDLHTGLGRRQLQLLPNPPYNQKIAKQRQEIFEVGGRTIEQTGGSDFYASFGDFSDFVCQYSESKFSTQECTGMLIEFGTLADPSWIKRGVFGMIKDYINQAYTLYLVTRENQAFHHGAESLSAEKDIRSAWARLFNPNDDAWRAMVVSETRLLMPKFLEKFAIRS